MVDRGGGGGGGGRGRPPLPARSSTFPPPQPQPLHSQSQSQSNTPRKTNTNTKNQNQTQAQAQTSYRSAKAQQFEGLTKAQSVTLRMAAVSLSNGGGGGGGGGKESPTRLRTGAPPGWQSRSGGGGGQNQSQTYNGNGNVKNARSRQHQQRERERDWELVNLDDLPPPSLRSKSPAPPARVTVPSIQIRTHDLSAPSRSHNHQTHSRQAQVRPQTPQTPPALPPRRWTPSSSPTTTAAPKLSYPNHNINNNNRAHHNNQGQGHAGRNANRNSKVESPVPVGGRGSRPDIPMILFPDDDGGDGGGGDDDGYEDEDEGGFGGGPSIMVSGPDEAVPRIAVSAPQISISGPDNGSSSSRSRPQTRSKPSTTTTTTTTANGPSSRRPAPQSHPEPTRDVTRPPVKRRGGGLVCGGCDGAIIGRIVSAMGVRWHPGCFRCTVCNELLEHVSSYEHEGWPYCHLDYHENFAPRCYHCKTAIIDERFITLDDPALGKRTYHEQHFFCSECGDPFLAPRHGSKSKSSSTVGELNISGDGEFEDDDVGFTVYKGYPYCESCHVRLRLPKCKRCKKSIRDGMEAVEALGGKWCWECFTCASCEKPFDEPSFFQRNDKPFCETCFSLILRNEV